MNTIVAAPLGLQSAYDPACWHANLTLHYDQDASQRTRPSRREHYGPLRVQKGFPSPVEQPDLWEQIIVHPPGGIAAGDQLNIRLDLADNTHVLLTSPGAAKWYRARLNDDVGRVAANDGRARQSIVARVGNHASLEWLPLENIVFNAADAQLRTQIDLAKHASVISAELVCLGREAGGESFTDGRLQLDTRVTREGRLLFFEQANLDLTGRSDAGVRALHAPAGLGGASCFGTLLAVPRANCVDSLNRHLTALHEQGDIARAIQANTLAITALPELILARWRGHNAQHGWQVLRLVWKILRHALLGHQINEPRIWQC